MNVLVAVNAEVLPVAAVGWVVVVIAVLVMHRQQVAMRGVELPAAAATDQPVEDKRPFAIIHLAGGAAPS